MGFAETRDVTAPDVSSGTLPSTTGLWRNEQRERRTMANREVRNTATQPIPVPACEWFLCDRPATGEVYNMNSGATKCLCAEHLDRALLAAGTPWQEC